MWDGVAVIEIVAGRDGLYGLRNANLIGVGGVIALRNATLEDGTWRTAGGATKVGTTVGAAARAALDYFPSLLTQRTIAAFDDGTVRKDDGSGAAHVTLVSGLTTAGAIPFLINCGAEQAGNNRKVAYCDGVNAVRILAADGVTMSVISAPPADWAGSNQPRVLVVDHQGYMWGGGNNNGPHQMHRSLNTNHESFTGTAFNMLLGPDLEEQYITAARAYKTGLLVWKFPVGVYFIDLSDPTPANWRAVKVGRAGCAGPGNVAVAEDDVIWVAPDGSWHAISATNASGSVHSEDFAARKLGHWAREQMNLEQLASAQLIYYSQKQDLELACHAQGQAQKNRRLHLDIQARPTSQNLPQAIPVVGERWHWGDRDRNEALFLRYKNGIQIPAMLDADGQLWELDRPNRNADSAGYTFEWFLADSDFADLVPGWKGRKKNGRFFQIEHVPQGSATHTVEIYRDGSLKQTITLNLSGGGAVLPQVLPFTLGTDAMQVTARRKLEGQAHRWAFRGYTTIADQDVSIARILAGFELAA
jgi:hypothetical protein